VTSPAAGVTHVNVLLPAHYNRSSSRRYPVVYLLHGAGGSYSDWAGTATAAGQPQGGDVVSRVGTLPIIVVMPDCGAVVGRAGAAKYAPAPPGLFGYLGTFSGAPDNDLIDSTVNWYTVFNARGPSTTPDNRCTFDDPFTTDAKNSASYSYDNDPTYGPAISRASSCSWRRATARRRRQKLTPIRVWSRARVRSSASSTT
jgi:hypothetical protein